MAFAKKIKMVLFAEYRPNIHIKFGRYILVGPVENFFLV
jgi:hypothetical protein